MSLVLEALKKADAERERERAAVPGLHASPTTLAPPPQHRRPAVLAWSVTGVAVVVAAVFGWQALRRDAAPAVVSVAPAPAPAPAPAAAPAPPVAAAPAAPEPAAPVAAPPAPRRVPPARVEPPAAPPPPQQPPTAAARQSAPVREPTPAPPPSQATAPATPKNGENIGINNTENIIYDNAQALPDEAKRGLPALTIGGAMYSETAANRMLIVNGQLFREKDVLAPGLMLEQIALKSAVMRWRNYRFRVSY